MCAAVQAALPPAVALRVAVGPACWSLRLRLASGWMLLRLDSELFAEKAVVSIEVIFISAISASQSGTSLQHGTTPVGPEQRPYCKGAPRGVGVVHQDIVPQLISKQFLSILDAAGWNFIFVERARYSTRRQGTLCVKSVLACHVGRAATACVSTTLSPLAGTCRPPTRQIVHVKNVDRQIGDNFLPWQSCSFVFHVFSNRMSELGRDTF